MTDRPAVTVVIPTFNRCRQLTASLTALAAQVDVDGRMEVIVVSDGSTDGTDRYLESGAPLPVVALRQANQGPAAARNLGTRTAQGDLVVFLDDDVVPAPDLVAAHQRRHAGADDLVVIGPMRTPEGFELSPWVRWEQDMLYKQYDAMARGDYRATARQFYTGNASVARRHLEAVGGFDTAFRRAEDVELAYRLADRGLRFDFDPAATVLHYAERSYRSWLDTAYSYGRNDVVFARDRGQRWLLAAIGAEFHRRHAFVRALTRFSLRQPRAGRAMTSSLGALARATARVGARRLAGNALSAVYNLSYYRGMGDELDGAGRLVALLAAAARPPAARPRVGFVLEQTLGHITHAANLRSLVAPDPSVDALFAPLEFEVSGAARRLPGFGNWTVRAGVRARSAVRRLRRTGPLDALFVHSQVPAIGIPDVLRRTPTIVSVDATPLQYDELGEHYGHSVGSPRLERVKWRLNSSCFARAALVVAWAEWTKRDLVDRYGVPENKVVVIPPGVDLARWVETADASGDHAATGPIRVLFVGGDLARKGGLVLLEAVRQLRAEGLELELDLVTRDAVADTPGVRVHHGLGPNSPALIELYRTADIFCLPTLGDCLPMVLSEAGALGLPLVSTDVGAVSEIVRDGRTGLLVPVDDVPALAIALRRLATEPGLRRELGNGARRLVAADFDASKNAHRLVELLVQVGRGEMP